MQYWQGIGINLLLTAGQPPQAIPMFDGEDRGLRRFAFHIEPRHRAIREELAAIVEKIGRSRGIIVHPGFRVAKNHVNNDAAFKTIPSFNELQSGQSRQNTGGVPTDTETDAWSLGSGGQRQCEGVCEGACRGNVNRFQSRVLGFMAEPDKIAARSLEGWRAPMKSNRIHPFHFHFVALIKRCRAETRSSFSILTQNDGRSISRSLISRDGWYILQGIRSLEIIMKFGLRAILAPMALAAAGLYAQSGEMHRHHAVSQTDRDGPVVEVSGLTIPDVELVDQHGKKVRFYSDLIKGRVVAINTIFTTCTTICPLMGANIAKLSKMLSDAGDNQVNLISISIDPVVDTPQRLDEWSRKFGPTGTDWTLLTGPKPEIDGLLKALQVFTPEKQDHAP